jgi:phage-related protein (TIGR01555 family)
MRYLTPNEITFILIAALVAYLAGITWELWVAPAISNHRARRRAPALRARALDNTVPPTSAEPPPATVKAMRISGMVIERAKMTARQLAATAGEMVMPYDPPPGVVPNNQRANAIAMDETPYDYINQSFYCAERFRGYPYLAMLSQLPDYRKMSETIAKQMTRKWIKLTTKGDDDKTEKLQKLEAALEKFKVRELFQGAAELDGFFGRGQIYIDVKTPRGQIPARDDPDELQTPLLMTSSKIAKDSLIGFTLIEPMWTYPNQYNTRDPLAPDYYKPRSWYVMGKTVHASRLLMFSSRPVPDILKASYNFGGLSLSQLAEPAVNNWLRTRDSVSDLIHSFSITGIKTNMGTALSGGDGSDMFARADLFNETRDNRGLMMLDLDAEEMFQLNTPLSGIADLQSQAQEQPAAVSNIPLVFLLGITPNGMNATSEGEIEVFYSYIGTMQDTLFRAPLNKVLDVLQLNEFGSIDEDIGAEFVPLSEMTPEQRATIEKTKADTDAVLIDKCVISPDDARDRLIADPNNDYHGLEPGAPDLPEDDNGAGDD